MPGIGLYIHVKHNMLYTTMISVTSHESLMMPTLKTLQLHPPTLLIEITGLHLNYLHNDGASALTQPNKC